MFKRAETPDDDTTLPPAGPERNSAVRRISDDSALDTLAALLRTLAKHAIEIETLEPAVFRRDAEAWALHVLLGTPYPGADPRQPSDGRRHWGGLKQFITEQRRKEQQFVTGALGDFRQVIWAFIESLNTTLIEDQQADEQVKQQLERLKAAAEGKSVEDLKREAIAAVTTLTQIAESRRKQRQEQIEELGCRVKALAEELREAKVEVELDQLTRLFNRSALQDHLERVVNLKSLFGQPASLIIIDLDHFKWINDSFGHLAGDAVLTAFSESLVRTFPRKGDCVARYGGDEFVVVLSDTGANVAASLTDRLLNVARSLQIDFQGETLRTTISAGMAEIVRGESSDEWLSRADRALYRAKESGRDRMMLAEH